jgi:cytochrome c5
MKKAFVLAAALLTLTVAASILLMPSKAASNLKTGMPVASSSIPDSIMKIFQKSCMDCHSNDGSGLAKSKVNFSVWDTYKPEKQSSKALDICKMVEKGAMPPKGWRNSNPDDVPTAADVKALCRWSSTQNP